METQVDYYVTPTGRARARVGQIITRRAAYKKIIEGALLLCRGMWELVTETPAPDYREVLRD